MLLHGGPGLDHHEFRPWLDPLGGHGPAADLRRRARPGRLAAGRSGDALGARLRPGHRPARGRRSSSSDYAVLGHSFGAIIALSHALERGTAEPLRDLRGRRVERGAHGRRRARDRRGSSRRRCATRSGARGTTRPALTTVEQARENTAAQMPFHFWEMGDAYSRYMQADETVYAPEVLAHFAAQGYGDFEWLDHLRWIRRPMLVIVGRYDRTCTLARSEEIHREVEGSELVVIEKAAHMAHVEQPKAYIDAVRWWFIRQGVLPDPTRPRSVSDRAPARGAARGCGAGPFPAADGRSRCCHRHRARRWRWWLHRSPRDRGGRRRSWVREQLPDGDLLAPMSPRFLHGSARGSAARRRRRRRPGRAGLAGSSRSSQAICGTRGAGRTPPRGRARLRGRRRGRRHPRARTRLRMEVAIEVDPDGAAGASACAC